jgi:hypothetical protein
MDLLDKLGCPTALTIVNLVEKAGGDMAEWLLDRRNRRALPHRLERCGYVSIRNRDAKDGLWKFNDRRQVIYVRAELLREQQLEAALMLVQCSRG